MRVRVYRWKAPWVGKALAFHEAPAKPILAASESTLGVEEKRSQRATRRRRQGCQRRSVIDVTRRKKTPPRDRRPVAEVGTAP
jgi:hypothetical protein